jgi:deoxyribose-phosphate aldolase
VPVALEALEGSGIPVAAVAAGFPAGLSPLPERIREVQASVAAGATEIDIVINRAHLFTGDWRAMYDEVRAFREACGDKAHLKSIIATGDLAILRNVARASLVCMMAGSDFIKTSTGKEAVNATLAVSIVIVRMIRSLHDETGYLVA